ncbi:hypothetical protein D3C76_1683960 [compost metagenome]
MLDTTQASLLDQAQLVFQFERFATTGIEATLRQKPIALEQPMRRYAGRQT